MYKRVYDLRPALPLTPDNREQRIPLWDGIGMSASGLCVLHCAAMPVVLALLPFWPLANALHGWLHLMFAIIIVPATAVALWVGYRRGRSRLTAALLVGGLSVILAAFFIGHSGLAETMTTLAGSGLLIAGHWRNWKSGATCNAKSVQHGDGGMRCND